VMLGYTFNMKDVVAAYKDANPDDEAEAEDFLEQVKGGCFEEVYPKMKTWVDGIEEMFGTLDQKGKRARYAFQLYSAGKVFAINQRQLPRGASVVAVGFWTLNFRSGEGHRSGKHGLLSAHGG